jgi:hypothetical protein
MKDMQHMEMVTALKSKHETGHGHANAPHEPMKHALVLGSLGAAVAAIGVVTTWNMDLGPKWYPISLVILALPEAWLGAKLAITRPAEAAG